ncbi:hypothetical protein [Halostagnicola kamekurae]|uniref:SPW repeat-containing protein n=1 Tax=Halostagnicola kamekurae TaxID=619731 RepID=A0A1I6U3U9_9EURY|nr:hypothetical protein [Halostagnicola kamekurae]SFS95957.1 hypothetical protein SAMN04488556_3517 [Halostagnicola kamekurae]
MVEVERWQYPWIILGIVLLGLSSIGGYLGSPIATIYPFIGSVGLLSIVIKPKAYPIVITGIGILSVALSGLLLVRDWSLLAVVILALVGIWGVILGVHTYLNRGFEQ